MSNIKVELINYTQNPIETIERAASVCYDSEWQNANGKIMEHCIKSGHLSVLEHASFTFKIEGISRACSHQLVRHRTGKFTQRSQRYCEENDESEYIVPKTMKRLHGYGFEDAYTDYQDTICETTRNYKHSLRENVPAEDARYILPNACPTTIVVTFDLRNLMHFFNERLCAKAQWEIRELAQKMRDCVIEVCSQLAVYLVPKCERYGRKYGFCTESKSCDRNPTLDEVFVTYRDYKTLEKYVNGEIDKLFVQLKSCGFKWIAKNKNGEVYAYETRPVRFDSKSWCGSQTVKIDIPILFLSWEDNEPYYLGD